MLKFHDVVLYLLFFLGGCVLVGGVYEFRDAAHECEVEILVNGHTLRASDRRVRHNDEVSRCTKCAGADKGVILKD